MIVKLLTEHHSKFLSLKGGCRDASQSAHIKMTHCWKSRALAQILMSDFSWPNQTGYVLFKLHKFVFILRLNQIDYAFNGRNQIDELFSWHLLIQRRYDFHGLIQIDESLKIQLEQDIIFVPSTKSMMLFRCHQS